MLRRQKHELQGTHNNHIYSSSACIATVCVCVGELKFIRDYADTPLKCYADGFTSLHCCPAACFCWIYRMQPKIGRRLLHRSRRLAMAKVCNHVTTENQFSVIFAWRACLETD